MDERLSGEFSTDGWLRRRDAYGHHDTHADPPPPPPWEPKCTPAPTQEKLQDQMALYALLSPPQGLKSLTSFRAAQQAQEAGETIEYLDLGDERG